MKMSCFDCFCACSRETSCRKKDSAVVQTNSGVLSDSSSGYLWQSENKISSLAADPGNCARSFAFRDLAIATQNFKEANLIGEGGFGRVYKGRLDSGQVVAIKQLNRDGPQGNNEFLVEVLMLIMLRHPNLVSLFGYCADGDERLLVYEYMPKGSLEEHLFSKLSLSFPANTPDPMSSLCSASPLIGFCCTVHC
ncbi:hypothetical protein BHM03_00053236 [Ensete ventricosum]|nr:hypothetical protein BHM03_00053236 [Ensete ventricosum]